MFEVTTANGAEYLLRGDNHFRTGSRGVEPIVEATVTITAGICACCKRCNVCTQLIMFPCLHVPRQQRPELPRVSRARVMVD